MLLALSLSRSLALLPPPLARLTYSGPAIWHRRWLATIPWPPGERRGLGRSVRGEGVRERGGVVVARPGPFPPVIHRTILPRLNDFSLGVPS